MYKVITDFIDLRDGWRRYVAGDTYPRDGYVPGEERINELASSDNKRGIPLIEKPIEEKPVEAKPKRRRKKDAD